MKKKRTYFARSLAVCAGFLLLNIQLFGFQSNSSQTDLGISWNVPENPEVVSDDLKLFTESGIRFVEILHPVSPPILDSLANYPLEVFIRVDELYLTTSDLSTGSDSLQRVYSEVIRRYNNYTQVRAYGLYAYSQSFDQDFTDRLELLLQEPRTLTSRDFYEIGTGPYNAADFSITKISSDSIPENTVSFLLNKQYNSGDFRITARLFDKAPALIFFDSGWFKEAISSHPSFKTALTEFKDSQEFVIPLLKSEKKLPDFKWTIFVYLLIWVSVGVHLRIVPTYSQLIPRYFTSHRFFVDDFMRYRERSASSGTFLFLQHALFTGLVAHIIATSFISPEGLGALYHHIPQAAIVGKNYASVFVLTVLLACILQLIGLFWLYLPNKAMSHFSQALNLYTWPLHLDFLIVSLMIILQQAGGSDILIVSLAVVFVLNWLTSFLITSIDGSKYLAQRRVSYIIYTFGLHLLLNILMITVILSSDYLLDLIDLVITI